MHSILCYLTLTALFWTPSSSQFVKQPGDVTRTAIPGYPLRGYIPCILERIPFQLVGWEHKLKTGEPTGISTNRSFHSAYQNWYEFLNNDQWDYRESGSTKRRTPDALLRSAPTYYFKLLDEHYIYR